MNTVELMTLFHRFEKEHDLFSQMVEGTPWWDSVRYEVFIFLEESLLGRWPVTSVPPLWRRAFTNVTGAVLRRKLYNNLGREHGGILFLRTPRTREGDQWVDRILDPIQALFKKESRYINTYPRRYHIPNLQGTSRSGSVPETLNKTLELFASTFDLPRDQLPMLEKTIRFRRYVYQVELKSYRDILDRAHPNIIILVQNGIEKSLFFAAKERNIQVIEAQHGLVDFSHPAYSYAPEISYSSQKTFPDFFLTFSEHWAAACYYPAGATIPVGNDSFLPSPIVGQELAEIMFVSSQIHHSALAPWVKKVARALQDRRIYYKLHPNQVSSAGSVTREFDRFPNVEVVSGKVSASTLMSNVSHVVAICSTVVYEALQAGRRVSLIPELNYQSHQDVFDLAAVTVPSIPEELIVNLSKPALNEQPIKFFNPFDPEKVREIIKKLDK